MTCERTRPQLTAYLDGDLEGERGSVVRGHLRECAACRQVATDEAALRDGLRMLPPVDPPPSLWAGVQAQLAAAEVADARRPAWKRALGRWMPSFPQFAAGGLVVAAAAGLLWWQAQAGSQPGSESHPSTTEPVAIAPVFKASRGAVMMPEGDVTADLDAERTRLTTSYGDAAAELLALATDARDEWSADRRGAFDARVSELRAQIADAADGRPRQRAWRNLIRYLQGAVVRDEVVLAGRAP